MQQFALNAFIYYFMQQTYRGKTSLQLPNGRGSVSKDDIFGCFAPVEYIMLKNNDILQSVCELECYARSKLN